MSARSIRSTGLRFCFTTLALFAILALLLTFCTVMLSGCSPRTEGFISATAIQGNVNDVTDLHDKFVRGEITASDLTDSQKENALLASSVLRSLTNKAASLPEAPAEGAP